MTGAMMTDAALAAALAEEAGKLLLEVQEDGALQGKALGDAGDIVANRYLMDSLRAQRPDDAILSEEEADNLDRVNAERVWIIDPLDGTREYSERRTDWAVHVALAIGGDAVTGAVALPGLGLVLRSDQTAPLAAPQHPPKILVSRTRPAREALAVAEAIGAELVPLGSAGAKAMAVVRGEADIYLHSGGQYQWDNCAPVAVARAHGLHCSRIDGLPLVYNSADTRIPDLLICRPEWAARVLALVAG